jgi:hypothetical protein
MTTEKLWQPTSGTDQMMLEDYCFDCARYRRARCSIFVKWLLSTADDKAYQPPEWKSKTGVYLLCCEAFTVKSYNARAARLRPVDPDQIGF